MSYLVDRGFVAKRKLFQLRAKLWLDSQPELKKDIRDYTKSSEVTGCSLTDYWALWHQIRNKKPREVLELGTGVSSLVVAHALLANEKDTGHSGRVTSMEESPFWSEKAAGLMPHKYEKIVDIRLSPTQDDCFSIFRGVSYKEIPDRPYEFVFVDGPSPKSIVDGVPVVNIDFLNIVRKSQHPVSGIVDKRVSSCFVYQQILGTKKVVYDPTLHIGFLNSCSKKDFGDLPSQLSSVNFSSSFKLFGKTKLGMKQNQGMK